MRKKMVLEGDLCDVCGRIATPRNMYVGGYNDFGYVSPKTLTIKMDGGPFYNIGGTPHRKGGKIPPRKFETVCPKCAAKLSKRFEEWLHECWNEGEMEREKRRLDFERKWADGCKKDTGQKGEEESREGTMYPQ